MGTKYEQVLFHVYYEKIKQMCFDDEPGTKIASWVKNTINADENIPADKKEEYYLTDKTINSFKALLKEQTQDITVKMPTAQVMTAASVPALIGNTKPETNEKKVYAPIIAKDVEKNVLAVNETFLNMFTLCQQRMLALMEKADQFEGFTDQSLERTIRGYMSELRQMFDLYCKMTGREEFAKALGAGMGNAVVQNMMSDTTKAKLKTYVRDLLAQVSPDEIPTKLAELEVIISGK